jgi:hypothetical protein
MHCPSFVFSFGLCPDENRAGSRVLRPPSGSRESSRKAGNRKSCRTAWADCGRPGSRCADDRTGSRCRNRQTGAEFGSHGLRFHPSLQQPCFGYTTTRWLQRSCLLHFPRRWYRQLFPAACTGSGQSPHNAVSAPDPSDACWQ